MSLYNKIIQLRPNLTDIDFDMDKGTILLQNDNNGQGDYIAQWNHATETQPTQAEIDGV